MTSDMDNIKSFFFPNWVKFFSLGLLLLCIATSTYFVINFIGNNNTDVLVIGLSLGQVAASALIILLITFYSERDISIDKIKEATNSFVTKILPESLLDLDFSKVEFVQFSNKVINQKMTSKVNILIKKHATNGVYYKISAKNCKLTMFVRINIKSILIIYFVPVTENISSKIIQEKFKNCFEPSKGMGYNIYFNHVAFSDFDGLEYIEVTIIKNIENTFLVNSFEKLFYAQDICSMTHSFILESQRQEIKLVH